MTVSRSSFTVITPSPFTSAFLNTIYALIPSRFNPLIKFKITGKTSISFKRLLVFKESAFESELLGAAKFVVI